MKKILFCFVVLLTCHVSQAQMFYDAIRLKRSYDANGGLSLENDSNISILKKYFKVDTLRCADLDKNKFLAPLCLGSTSANPPPQPKAGAFSFSAIGNFNVTSIADGLAQFLIKRGKEELNIAFFQRMKEFLDKNEEAKTLFPATSAFLGNIASYRYAELLQSLREAFYKDISNIIINLNLLIDLPKYQQLLAALPEIRVAVRSAKTISALSQGNLASIHPARLIDQVAGFKEWGEMNVNLQSSWKLLSTISTSVRTEVSSVTAAWISFSDFQNNILADSITLKIFLGLLYQKTESIVFKNADGKTFSVQAFMQNNQNNIWRIADLVENFLLLANNVEQSIHEIEQKKESGLSNEDYYTYINKAIDIIDYGFKVANIVNPGVTGDRYIIMARNATDLYKNIYTKNYNAAVMNTYLILNELSVKSKNAIEEKKQYYDSIRKSVEWIILTAKEKSRKLKDSAAFMASRLLLEKIKFLQNDTLENRKAVVEKILRYGNLIASIVKAETSAEASAAIEAAVLPAGSSSIKKNTAWNISLNAYIGGYFGRSVNNTDKIDGNSSKLGITAPVGIAFSKGLGYYKNGTGIGSLSLYGTLIDVGAIAGYRLNNDSTALDSKITLNDIFTPGGYIVYGIGLPFKWLSYVPLSVGYGWQYGSKLYYKTGDGTLAISNNSRWRSNWFICIDIPLANFLTLNYNRIKD